MQTNTKFGKLITFFDASIRSFLARVVLFVRPCPGAIRPYFQGTFTAISNPDTCSIMVNTKVTITRFFISILETYVNYEQDEETMIALAIEKSLGIE